MLPAPMVRKLYAYATPKKGKALTAHVGAVMVHLVPAYVVALTKPATEPLPAGMPKCRNISWYNITNIDGEEYLLASGNPIW